MKSFDIPGVGQFAHGEEILVRIYGKIRFIPGKVHVTLQKDKLAGIFILTNDSSLNGGAPKELQSQRAKDEIGYQYSWWYYAPGLSPSVKIAEITKNKLFDEYEII
jgi:hypothetical protein